MDRWSAGAEGAGDEGGGVVGAVDAERTAPVLEDLAGAQVLLADGSVALRIVGFLSQQAVEKALKVGLFSVSVPAPKINGLQQLLGCYPEGNTPEVDLV